MICKICLEEKKDNELIYCYLCGFKCCKECFIKNTKINKYISCVNCKRNININVLYKYLDLNEINEIKDYYLENIINKDKDEFNILKYKITFYKNIYNIFKIIKIYSNDINDIFERIKLLFNLNEDELNVILETYEGLNDLLDIDDLKITLYIFNIIMKSFILNWLDYNDRKYKLFIYFACLYSYIIEDEEIYNYIIKDIMDKYEYNIFKSYWIIKHNSIMKIIKDCEKRNDKNKILNLTNLKKYKKEYTKEEKRKIYIKLLLQYFNNLKDINNINVKIIEKRKIISCNYCNGFCYKENNYLICNICNKKYCLNCYKELNEKHKCKEEDIENIKLLFKNSKRCPNCYNLIERTEGCKDMWCRFCDTLFNLDTLEIMEHNTNEIYKNFKKDIKDDIDEYNKLNINEQELKNFFSNIFDLSKIYKFNKIYFDNDDKYFNQMKIKILFYMNDDEQKKLYLNYYNSKFKCYKEKEFYINYYNFLIDTYLRLINRELFNFKNDYINCDTKEINLYKFYLLLCLRHISNTLIKNIIDTKKFLEFNYKNYFFI